MALFVTLEGIEGAGKSTLQRSLAAALAADGHETVLTREPGATAVGQEIRNLLLHTKSESIAETTEVFLFAADRAQHVREVIQPALARNAIVICDRFTHSTLAYQGYGRGISLELLTAINNIATEGLAPDLTLLLDCEPDVGLRRVEKRSADEPVHDRFEAEALEFHQRIRSGFKELAARESERFSILNAEASPEELVEAALIAVRRRLSSSEMV